MRADGRLALQARPSLCKSAVLLNADGSSRWAAEGTAVLAAVYGPRAVPSRREQPGRAVLEVVVAPAAGLRGAADRASAADVAATLEAVLLSGLHPRSGVSVVLQVLHADGSLLAALVNAAVAAAADAGLPLSGLPAAAAVAVTPEGALLLDPTAAEEQAACGVATFAFLPRSPGEELDIVLSASAGQLRAEQYLAALGLARKAAAAVLELGRATMANGAL